MVYVGFHRNASMYFHPSAPGPFLCFFALCLILNSFRIFSLRRLL